MTTLTAEETYTVPKLLNQGAFYSVSIRGSFSGTITVQRSRDGITEWRDIHSETGPKELDGQTGSGWFIRAGFKTGNYTSGSAEVDVY